MSVDVDNNPDTDLNFVGSATRFRGSIAFIVNI